MKKVQLLFLLPFLLVAGMLLYCWAILLTGGILATWKHYAGLFLFAPIVLLLFRKFQIAVIALGIYLLLATFNLLAITPAITTSWINIGSGGLRTPPVQLSSLGILILYLALNINTLIEIELDYSEARASKAKTDVP
jgi:hypothetical protein